MTKMFKPLHNYTHFTCQQDNAQNPLSYPLAVHELRTSQCTSWIQKSQRNQRSNCQHLLDHRKSKVIPEKASTFASLTTLTPLTVWITTNCGKFLKRWEYKTTLPASCEICSRTRSNSQNWTWNKGLVQNWERNMSTCLFNLHTENIR